MGIGPVVGIKSPLPGFNPAAHPGVLPMKAISNLKNPLPGFNPSSARPTANPSRMIPVIPLPGGGGGGGGGSRGYPI